MLNFFKKRYTKVTKTTQRDPYSSNKTIDVDEVSPNVVTIVVDVVIGVFSLIMLSTCWPFYSVPTGSRGVVTQFGRIVGIEPEGLAILPPWQKLSLFSIRAEQANIDNAPGATKDTQPVHTSLTVRYSILPDKVSEVFEKYSHNGDLASYVQTGTMEVFKAVTAQYDAPDLIGKRALVSNDIYAALTKKLAQYGAQVIAVDMRDFKFQDSYMIAINSKVEQEQLRLAADNKLLTVQSEQKQKVAIAEAEAGAVKAAADGDAYATVANAKANAQQVKLNAEAQAEAIKVQQAALAAGQQVLELRRIEVLLTQAQKWDGKLPEAIYAGAPIPFINTANK